MDKILQSIFVHVDAASKTLASNAMAQLLVKLLYTCDQPVKREELIKMIDTQLHRKITDDEEFRGILDRLIEKKEISFKKNQYSLTTSKKERIRRSIEQSRSRVDKLLNDFFSGLHSDPIVIKEWFQTVTLKFFEIYADHWISDLLAGSQHLRNLGESIRSTIENRTKSFEGVDKRDVEELKKRFFKLVTTHNADVDAYLWEHGTSRFSAMLISNKQGVDRLTIESFSGSTCLLDTNILIFIALGSKDMIKSYELLEEVFLQLGITVKILHITKTEFEHRIDVQRDVTIKNIDNVGGRITKIPNDSFTHCAIERMCSSKEDFERFFDELRQVPEFVIDKLKIELLDNNKELAEAIETAQKDAAKKENLKRLYFQMLNRNKPENATIHDVGLIEGAEFLRKAGKLFILSEETSVNAYSQGKPVDNGLPIAIRVQTLLNILATNGNSSSDSSDYMALYADLIRMDLSPAEKTFTQCQLFQMYELNSKIGKLPVEETERIVWDVHDKMMRGMKDEDLRLYINDRITETEIDLRDEVSIKTKEIAEVKDGLKKETRNKKQFMNALYEQYYKEEKKRLRNISICQFVLIPCAILFFGLIIAFVFLIRGDCNFVGFCLSVFATLSIDVAYMIWGSFRKGILLYRNRMALAKQEASKRIKEIEEV